MSTWRTSAMLRPLYMNVYSVVVPIYRMVFVWQGKQNCAMLSIRLVMWSKGLMVWGV